MFLNKKIQTDSLYFNLIYRRCKKEIIVTKEEKVEKFLKLVDILEKLRGEKGCPWDKKQNHQTLMKYLFEEAQEYDQAVQKQDYENMKEELGDVLLQVIFHAQIAKENKKFDIYDVLDTINEKMIRRHPHVFGNSKATSEEEIRREWEEIKAKEKQNKCS
jgi:tetrapyrrole methylase family protein/MazG family protein